MADVSATSKGVTEGADYEALFYTNTGAFGSGVAAQGLVLARRDGTVAHGGVISVSASTSNASLTTGAGTNYSSGDVIGVPIELTGCGVQGEVLGMVLRDTNGNIPDGDNVRVLLFDRDPTSGMSADNAALADPIPNLSWLVGGGTVSIATNGFGWCNSTGTFGHGYSTNAGSLWAVFWYASATGFTFTATTGGLSLNLRLRVT